MKVSFLPLLDLRQVAWFSKASCFCPARLRKLFARTHPACTNAKKERRPDRGQRRTLKWARCMYSATIGLNLKCWCCEHPLPQLAPRQRAACSVAKCILHGLLPWGKRTVISRLFLDCHFCRAGSAAKVPRVSHRAASEHMSLVDPSSQAIAGQPCH